MAASYKIPQNVELEDKIIGPFTLRQFLYLLGGGLVTFVSFSTVYTASQAAFFVIAFFTWTFVTAFVFIKPYDQSFLKFITSFINFSTRPSRRAWKRLPTLGEIKLEDHQGPPKVVKEEPSDEEVRSKLARLAHVIDARGWSDVDSETAGRITSDAEAKPKLNIFMAHEEEPADILAREDAGTGSDRVSANLDTVIKESEKRPQEAQGA
ncbi:MAG: PrgI family protein [Patescibacteria group bacterium]|nr:PrgI family protein [Patescibacteria group bacterium]